RLPVEFEFEGDKLAVKYSKGPALNMRLLAPARTSAEAPRREVVESNAFYRWERFHLADPHWPRVIEVRADVSGQLVVVGHLQRNLSGDGRAPDLGWEVEGFPLAEVFLDIGKQDRPSHGTKATRDKAIPIDRRVVSHSYTNGEPCTL